MLDARGPSLEPEKVNISGTYLTGSTKALAWNARFLLEIVQLLLHPWSGKLESANLRASSSLSLLKSLRHLRKANNYCRHFSTWTSATRRTPSTCIWPLYKRLPGLYIFTMKPSPSQSRYYRELLGIFETIRQLTIYTDHKPLALKLLFFSEKIIRRYLPIRFGYSVHG